MYKACNTQRYINLLLFAQNHLYFRVIFLKRLVSGDERGSFVDHRYEILRLCVR